VERLARLLVRPFPLKEGGCLHDPVDIVHLRNFEFPCFIIPPNVEVQSHPKPPLPVGECKAPPVALNPSPRGNTPTGGVPEADTQHTPGEEFSSAKKLDPETSAPEIDTRR